MDDSLEQLLADVAAGLVPAADAADRLRRFGYAAVGDYARLDVSRAARKGVPEVVYAAGKTSEQLVAIAGRFLQHGPVVLCSRVSPEQAAALAAGIDADIDYDEGTIYGFFPKGFQHAEVRYVAGYATIPNAVQTACCMVVKALSDQSKNDATLQYEKLGDYSWGRRTDQLISLENAIFADALPLLRKYKRIAAM